MEALLGCRDMALIIIIKGGVRIIWLVQIIRNITVRTVLNVHCSSGVDIYYGLIYITFMMSSKFVIIY